VTAWEGLEPIFRVGPVLFFCVFDAVPQVIALPTKKGYDYSKVFVILVTKSPVEHYFP
jgi:hypothetical protein